MTDRLTARITLDVAGADSTATVAIDNENAIDPTTWTVRGSPEGWRCSGPGGEYGYFRDYFAALQTALFAAVGELRVRSDACGAAPPLAELG